MHLFLRFVRYYGSFIGVLMKKMFIVGLLALNLSIYSDSISESGFERFEKKESGSRYAGRVFWTKIGYEKIPGLDVDELDEKLTFGEKTFNFLNKEKFFLKCLKHRSMFVLYNEGTEREDKIILCGGSFDQVQALKNEQMQPNRDRFKALGWQLRSNSINLFPMNEEEKRVEIAQINENNEIEKQHKGIIAPNEAFAISLPCKIIVVDLDEKSSVSNEELGFIAAKLLARDSDFQYDGVGYSMKLTVLTVEEYASKPIDASLFHSKRP